MLSTKSIKTYYAKRTEYTYKSMGGNQTTTLIEKLNHVGDRSFTYGYDKASNITSVTDSFGGSKTTNYTYDTLGQLTREDNQSDGKSYVYEYDKAGNILKKRTGNYTTGTLGTMTDVVYKYEDGIWADMMTSYNGQTITYDQIGNPRTYRDGMTFTWTAGRQLAKYVKGNDTVSYKYNDNGIRTQKTVGTVVTDYFLDGSEIAGYKTSNQSVAFMYDENGSKYGFILDGIANYYYQFNVQGDVVTLLNAAGNVVARYSYDAWGNVKVMDSAGNVNTTASFIGNINPIRYRGYYYDNESGLYYLQSRYYDPAA